MPFVPNLLKILPLLGFAGLAVTFALRAYDPEVAAPAGYLDRPLPVFDQPALAGMKKGLASSELRREVSLINVFASWCSACRLEHPMLMELAARGDVPIYGLNWKDRKGAGKLFLAQFGNPYRATGEDRDGVFGAQLNVTGVPETYVLDANLRLRYRHIGPITKVDWDQVILPLIQKLREEL